MENSFTPIQAVPLDAKVGYNIVVRALSPWPLKHTGRKRPRYTSCM
jgi:hypothetical protein